MIEQYKINTFDDLCSLIQKIQKKENVTLWYRGHTNDTWEIIPSIQRSNLASKERIITHSFYHSATQIANDNINYTAYDKWAAKMQHYGIPTRLLDWSYSPLVALYFATKEFNSSYNIDACIWILLPSKLNMIQNFGPYIYPIDSFTAIEMLKPAFTNKNINRTIENKILACFSTNNDLRMYSQQAAFTIHNTNRKLIDYNDILYKVIIPSNKIDYFKNIIKTVGITDSYIFPDLEHIAKDVLDRHSN